MEKNNLFTNFIDAIYIHWTPDYPDQISFPVNNVFRFLLYNIQEKSVSLLAGISEHIYEHILL